MKYTHFQKHFLFNLTTQLIPHLEQLHTLARFYLFSGYPMANIAPYRPRSLGLSVMVVYIQGTLHNEVSAI